VYHVAGLLKKPIFSAKLSGYTYFGQVIDGDDVSEKAVYTAGTN